MLITRLRLENWKNFSTAELHCGKRVFIIGPNASGKSNLLDALRFLRDIAKDGLERAVEERGGLKLIRYIEARSKPNITINVMIDDVWEYALTFGSEPRKSAPRVIEEIVKKNEAGEWKTIVKRPDNEDKTDPGRLAQTALQQVNANKDFRPIADFFTSIQYRHIIPQLVREPKLFLPGPLIDNDPFGRDLVFTIWKTPEKTRSSRLGRINKALQAAVPNLKNLTVEQDDNGTPHFKVNYQHWRPRGAYQSESSFSDGTLRLLALFWSLLDIKGPLLLEEPELSLHDEIVALLPSLLFEAEKSKKKAERQVFITTHAKALLRDPGIGASEVIRLEPGKNGVEVKTATSADIRLLEESGLTAADVFTPKTRPSNIEQLRLF